MAGPKEERILEAAYELFDKNGFHQTKISDIAKASGIGKGTVYEYFSSKEEILEKVIWHMFSQYEEKLRANIDKAEGALSKVRAFLETDAGIFKEKAGFLEMLQGAKALESLDKKELARNTVVRSYLILRDVIANGVASGELIDDDVDAITMMIHGSFHYTLMAIRMIENGEERLNSSIDFIIRRIRNG